MGDNESESTAQPSSSLYEIFRATLQSQRLRCFKPKFSYCSLQRRVEAKGIITVHRPTECEDARGNVDVAISSQYEAIDTGKRYAIQGSHLLNTALVEAEARDPRHQSLSRKLYVDSITYLLHGLPPDLNQQEVSHLQSALPESLHETTPHNAPPHEPQPPSVLHRSISAVILSICLLLRLIFPYIKYLLALAYSYERTHRVTENALAAGITTVDSIGRKSVDVTGAALNNELIMGAVTYCVEGICGGLNEGLGKGMKAIEAGSEH